MHAHDSWATGDLDLVSFSREDPSSHLYREGFFADQEGFGMEKYKYNVAKELDNFRWKISLNFFESDFVRPELPLLPLSSPFLVNRSCLCL